MHPQATVDRARDLSRQGLIDREVALIVGVPIRTIRKWRTGQRRAQEHGSAKAACPRCNEEATLLEPAAEYAYLLGLYLGDGHITDRLALPP
jgi:transposase